MWDVILDCQKIFNNSYLFTLGTEQMVGENLPPLRIVGLGNSLFLDGESSQSSLLVSSVLF